MTAATAWRSHWRDEYSPPDLTGPPCRWLYCGGPREAMEEISNGRNLQWHKPSSTAIPGPTAACMNPLVTGHAMAPSSYVPNRPRRHPRPVPAQRIRAPRQIPDSRSYGANRKADRTLLPSRNTTARRRSKRRGRARPSGRRRAARAVTGGLCGRSPARRGRPGGGGGHGCRVTRDPGYYRVLGSQPS